jgi:hypothetical protein
MLDLSFIDESDYIRGELFPEVAKSCARGNIFYSKIDYAPHVLIRYLSAIPHPFIFVTHNGDIPVCDKMLDIAKRIPNLKMWFGQNIECRPDPIIQSLPIGLENLYNFPEIEKIKKMRRKILEKRTVSHDKLLYLNFSINTNQTERRSAREVIIKNVLGCTDQCSDSVTQANYESWLDDVLSHQYVLCPRGNGIDTHRMWETLYLGRIPVVKRNTNTRYFEDLPILLVDSYEDVTNELLKSKISYFCEISNFNIKKLKFSYWKKSIENFGRSLS